MLWAATASAQMNGDAPGGLYHRSAPEQGLGTMLPVIHEVAHRGEFFDAYSPFLNTTYSEVFWTMMEETPLPADFVERFANKTVAITGCGLHTAVPTTTQHDFHGRI